MREGKVINLLPDPPFSKTKFILSHPVHMRTLLATIFKKKREIPKVDDLSIREFLPYATKFWS